LGISACCKYPYEITSPFSGRPLPEYILRDRDTYNQSPRGQILLSLKKVFGLIDPGTIDYLHLRKEYVPQLNRILSTFFWPGIDVSEAVDYPDYSIIAVYNTWLIVGAALIDPDGYLSHFFVHPDFSGSGIGSKLLQLLLRSAPPRDVTLHVSATNPAMLLYNRFGFKPEQYIVNHYDKFYRLAEQSEQCRALSALLPYSKNAFLMRLRR
jgi:cysteine-rich protein 2-binding protein